MSAVWNRLKSSKKSSFLLCSVVYMTLIDFFNNSVEEYGSNVFLWEKPAEKYEGTTYSEVYIRVREFAAGLITLGIKAGDRVAILSEGRNSWIIGELGILSIGAISVPISTKLNQRDIVARLNHSASRILLVSSILFESKAKNIISDCYTVENIIHFDARDDYSPNEIHFNEVRRQGREWLSLQENRLLFQEIKSSITADNVATIIYTTGEAQKLKGITLTHNNYITNIKQAYSLTEISSYHKNLLILPWSNSFGHTAGIYVFMGRGASIAALKRGRTSIDNYRNLFICIREIKPNIIFTVPALVKYFRKIIEKRVNEHGKYYAHLFRQALKISYLYNREGWNRGSGYVKILQPLVKINDYLFFQPIRALFGGELNYMFDGGALLDTEIQRFFYALGIPVYQGYGLTEASPIISCNTPNNHSLGSSGKIVDNIEITIQSDNGTILTPNKIGEIVVRGDNIMQGYWENEKLTQQVIRNGWLYTGDIGYISEKGFLTILGRSKSLLIADDGEKFSPERIEEAFCNNSPYIEQCLIYNNQNPYAVCIVVPNRYKIKWYLEENNLISNSEIAMNAALKLIRNEINDYRINGIYGKLFPQRWLPLTIGIVAEGFTEENGLLAPSQSINRTAILEQHKELIKFLYSPDAKEITNERNLAEIEKLLAL